MRVKHIEKISAAVGANIAFVPSIQDRLYGAITVQLKVKLY